MLVRAFLGILIYEMIVGQPPFCDEEPMGSCNQLCSTLLTVSSHLCSQAGDERVCLVSTIQQV